MGAAAVFERGDSCDELCNSRKIETNNLLSKDARQNSLLPIYVLFLFYHLYFAPNNNNAPNKSDIRKQHFLLDRINVLNSVISTIHLLSLFGLFGLLKDKCRRPSRFCMFWNKVISGLIMDKFTDKYLHYRNITVFLFCDADFSFTNFDI